MGDDITVGEILDLLATGTVEVLGLLPYSSNYVFLARVGRNGDERLAVYKPRKGERPLWDFPSGTLAAREVAAFDVSESADWGFVPPTVLRRDAPLGEGSLQLFIEHDPERHYFELVKDRLDDFAELAAFDIVINNADRKAGHVLEDCDGRLWAVDHGLAFNAHPKLRTVIWAFAGERFGSALRARLEGLRRRLATRSGPRADLERLLSPAEAAATLARLDRLLARGRFPTPSSGHHLPWPLV